MSKVTRELNLFEVMWDRNVERGDLPIPDDILVECNICNREFDEDQLVDGLCEECIVNYLLYRD